jgi:hypothetical protein
MQGYIPPGTKLNPGVLALVGLRVFRNVPLMAPRILSMAEPGIQGAIFFANAIAKATEHPEENRNVCGNRKNLQDYLARTKRLWRMASEK